MQRGTSALTGFGAGSHKKLLGLISVMILSVITLHAQEESIKRFSSGAALFFGTIHEGYGQAEFSFLLFHKEFDIRNHFVIRSGKIPEGNDSKIISLAEKISWGGFSGNGLFRMYGFAEGGIGLYGNNGKSMPEIPLAFTVGGGGGLDIFFNESISFCMECGYLGYWLDKEHYGGPVFQIGWKSWF
ncbi:MAG: hypothetical protein LBH42_08385 [Treponema sp.]|jgi:hypothetical protein|nr:hypothetical protein [Treponema sp.]